MTPTRYWGDTGEISGDTDVIPKRYSGARLASQAACVSALVARIASCCSIRSRRLASRELNMDMESAREWIQEHKLRAVGTLWATSLLGSLAYNFAKPAMKLHAQFLTLAALGGGALVEAYDQQAGDKAKRYEKQKLERTLSIP